MRYVKIREKTYNEAMMKLKMEYGEDAIPISHKYVKEGGLFQSKLFGKEVVELTAAVQERKMTSRPAAEKKRFDVTVGDDKAGSQPSLSQMMARDKKPASEDAVIIESLNRSLDALNDNLSGLRGGPATQKKRETAAGQPEEPEARREAQPAREEPQRERGSMDRFEREFNEIKSALDKLLIEKKADAGGLPHEKNDLIIKNYLDILRFNDFDAEECNSLISEVKNAMSREDLKDKFKIEKTLKELLRSKIVTTGPLKTGNKKKIVMFVGPTGVGKTTTMAKLGAIHALREGHRVSFITIDTYRIAATEQLKKYAEIMRIPVHVVSSQKEFKEVIAAEKADIIMVDTSGRSHRNELKISEIKNFADTVEYDFEKILCVSANTKKKDLQDVFKAFDVMNFNSVIITKVDESSFLGNVVSVADTYSKPIAYFTNGQEVPNDIVVADPDKIVDMMVGNFNN